MKSINRLKEEIGLDKLNITILSAIEIFFFCSVAAILLGLITSIYFDVYKKIKELGNDFRTK